MKIQNFIFVHNQDIVIDFIKNKKFNNLNNLKYVFLGNQETNKIENLDNVIIAKNLEYNIEQYPKLTSYTGWYALWKNNLIDSDYINLFEYDINVVENLESIILNTISEKNIDIIGYIPLSVHSYNYLQHIPWSGFLIKSILDYYNINIIDYISKLPFDKNCSMTSNHTMSKKSFEEYMLWINPLINHIKTSPLSGHEVERSISVFYLLNKKYYDIIPNVLNHFQFDSHNTQGIGKQKFINNYKELINN